jgi:predicted trehalose synthase
MRFWQQWVSVAFVKSYLEHAGQASFLPQTKEEIQLLLDFYLLSRGVFDLRYLLLNHPNLAEIPLQALRHLLELQDRTPPHSEADHPVVNHENEVVKDDETHGK